MDHKERQALKTWAEANIVAVLMPLTEIIWAAACEFKNREIAELKNRPVAYALSVLEDEYNHLVEEHKELQAELDLARETIVKLYANYRISGTNTHISIKYRRVMSEQDKEAFNEWFKDAWDIDFDDYDFRHRIQVKAWQAACLHKQKKIEELEKEQVRHIDILKDEFGTIIKSLQAENAKLRECVEFYADEDNWHLSDSCHADSISLDSEELLDHPDFASLGGKRARQCLKELDEKL